MRNRRCFCLLVCFTMLFFTLAVSHTVTALEGAAPVLSASPIIIRPGEPYDPLDGLTITDDKDLPSELLLNVKYYDSTDPFTIGTYDIYYYCKDSDGNDADLIRPVLVMDPEMPMIYARADDLFMGENVDLLQHVFAYDLKDGDLTSEVQIASGEVDPSAPGEYEILLQVTDSDGHMTERWKTIYVQWPQEYYPVITADDAFLPVGASYDPLEGVTAVDKTDGDITSTIQVEYDETDMTMPGIYWTQYRVMNSLGLMSYEDRRVYVYDPASTPVIFFTDIYLETDMQFHPLEDVTAYDLEDGNITDKITVMENTVDTSKAGEYYVRYAVVDSEGNRAEAERRITVEWSYEYYPSIKLEHRNLYLALNSSFDPLDGVTASDPNDGDLTDKIEITSPDVDTSIAGIYYVEYRVTNSRGINTWEYMSVYVMDSSFPVLEVYDFSVGLNEPLDIYMVHLEAYDLEDGDLRESVTWDISAVNTSAAGTYPVSFSVTDSSGNTASATALVTVIDYTFPELYVFDHVAYLNSDYDPLQNTYAFDNMDGDLTNQIVVVKNTVKIKKIGVYYVTYSVTNSQGKTTTKTVSVEVMKEPVMSFMLTYEGAQIPLETDETGNFAFIRSDTFIAAGAEVGIGILADGEPVFEILGIRNGTDILAGYTYSIFVSEDNVLVSSILPYLYQGSAYRYSPTQGAVKLKSTVVGMLYYSMAELGSPVPEIDISVNGQPITNGVIEVNLEGLTPGKAYEIHLITVTETGEQSNVYEMVIPKVPSRENKEDNKSKNDPGSLTPAPLENEVLAEDVNEPLQEKPYKKLDAKNPVPESSTTSLEALPKEPVRDEASAVDLEKSELPYEEAPPAALSPTVLETEEEDPLAPSENPETDLLPLEDVLPPNKESASFDSKDESKEKKDHQPVFSHPKKEKVILP